MAERPIPYTRLATRVATRDRLAEPPDVALQTTMFVAGREPSPETRRLERVLPSFIASHDSAVFRVDLDVPRVAIGVHSFAPGVEGTKLPARRRMLLEEDHADALGGFLPDHLALRTRPDKLDRGLARRVQRTIPSVDDPGVKWATTVFAPDERYAFSDTAFPWCTTGRVETSNGGWASGTMVGPRHLLTCSHCIGWIARPDPYVAGWIKFMPSYFDASTPFGTAWGTHIYWQQQVLGPTIDGTEERHDYVVVVLDRPMGELTGWMGSRTYDDTWDGGNYWSHIGYPQDVSGGSRPTFQGNVSLDGDDTQPASDQVMRHRADVIPGQSGGPMFGWWDGEPWPRAVADQSWQNASS